jgi:hypothetical protein
MNRKHIWASFAMTTVGVVAAAGCNVSVDETLRDGRSALRCDDFVRDGKIDGDLDTDVRVFLEASQEFRGVSGEIRGSVALDRGAKLALPAIRLLRYGLHPASSAR